MIGNELLWPGGQKTGDFDFKSAIEDLELERLGSLLFQRMPGPEAVAFAEKLATNDWNTIKMRQDVIKDILHEPLLAVAFHRLLKLVEEIRTYARGVDDNAAGLEVDRFDAVIDSMKKAVIKIEKSINKQGGDIMEEMSADNRYSLLLRSALFKYELLKRYSEAMTLLRDTLDEITVKSTALRALKAWAETQYSGDNVDDIRAKLTDISGWWKGLSAFAIDVNLDGHMMIKSMEVARLRPEPYEKNGMMDGKPSEPREGISSLIQFPQSGSGMWFQEYLLNEVGYEARRELLKLRSEVVKWKLAGQDGLISLGDSLKFYLAAAEMASRFTERRLPICAPECSESSVIDVRDAVLPEMALIGKELPIANDCRLGAEGHISLITGPNGSGKTSYIILVGQLIWLTQLGCLLPCTSASIRPCDSLMTMFAAGESDEGEDSRMGMEVIRLKEITERMTPRSLVLLNEPMTSTNAVEGIEICINLISELIAKKVSGLMVTHYGDIYDLFLKEHAGDETSKRFRSLVMTTDDSDGEITYLYKLIEAPPMMSSHARAVMESMGVTLDNMINRMNGLGMDMKPDDPSWDVLRRGEVL